MSAGILTTEEETAVRLLGEAWNALLAAVPDSQMRREAAADIHRLQLLILAQPAFRSQPSILRSATG